MNNTETFQLLTLIKDLYKNFDELGEGFMPFGRFFESTNKSFFEGGAEIGAKYISDLATFGNNPANGTSDDPKKVFLFKGQSNLSLKHFIFINNSDELGFMIDKKSELCLIPYKDPDLPQNLS